MTNRTSADLVLLNRQAAIERLIVEVLVNDVTLMPADLCVCEQTGPDGVTRWWVERRRNDPS